MFPTVYTIYLLKHILSGWTQNSVWAFRNHLFCWIKQFSISVNFKNLQHFVYGYIYFKMCEQINCTYPTCAVSCKKKSIPQRRLKFSNTSLHKNCVINRAPKNCQNNSQNRCRKGKSAVMTCKMSSKKYVYIIYYNMCPVADLRGPTLRSPPLTFFLIASWTWFIKCGVLIFMKNNNLVSINYQI